MKRERGISDSTEQLALCHDPVSGLRAAIAIDDTTLGPGLGGVRWHPCPDVAAAAEEACRLARVMTLKNACADLPYGGAKAVVMGDRVVGDRMVGDRSPVDDGRRRAQLLAFGRFVEDLGGAYIPGVDMGTSVADLAVIAQVAREVACTSEDPSPWTAQGVFAGIGAALDAAGVELVGARVVVQGVGHVGADLARRLTGAGCSVAVADVDPVRAAAVAEEIDGRVVDPRAAITSPCDVLAPCAAPRVIDRRVVDALECRVVAGAANDILATPDVAGRLARRHIVYVPDFVINAGGVLHIHALREGWGPEKLEESVRAIGDRVARILREADRSGRSPVTAAEEMAAHRLGRPIALPS